LVNFYKNVINSFNYTYKIKIISELIGKINFELIDKIHGIGKGKKK